MKKWVCVVLAVLLVCSLAGNAFLYVNLNDKKDESARLVSQLDAKSGEYDTIVSENETLKTEIAALNAQNAEKDAAYTGLSGQYDAAVASLEDQTAAYATLSDTYDLAIAELTGLNETLAQKSAECDEALQTVANLNADHALATQTIEALTKERDEKTAELDAVSADLEALAAIIADNETAYESLKAAYEEKNGALSALSDEYQRIHAQLSEMEAQSLSNNASYEELLNTHQAALKQADDVTKQLELQTAAYEQLKGNYEDTRLLLEESSGKVTALENDLAQAQAVVATLNESIGVLEASLENAEKEYGAAIAAQVTDARENAVNVATGMEKASIDAGAVSEKLKETIVSFESMLVEIESGLGAEDADKQGEIERLKKELQDMSASVEQLTENAQLNAEYVDQLQTTLTALNANITEIEKQIAKEGQADAEARYQALTETVDDMDAALTDAKKTMDIFISYNNALSERLSQMEGVVSETGEREADLRAQLTETDTQLTGAVEAMEAMKDEMAEITTSFADVQTELGETKARIAAMEKEVTDSRNALTSAESALASLSEEYAKTQTSLGDVQAQLKEKDAELAACGMQLTDATAQLEKALTDLAAAGSDLTDTKAALADMNSKYEDSQKALTEIKAALTATQETLNGTEQALREKSAAYDASEKTLSELRETLSGTQNALEDTRETLDATKTRLDRAESKLDAFFVRRAADENNSAYLADSLEMIEFNADGTAEVSIDNSREGARRFTLTLLGADGETLLEKAVAVGETVNRVKLISPLAAGEYACTLKYIYFDNRGEEASSLAFPVTVRVR